MDSLEKQIVDVVSEETCRECTLESTLESLDVDSLEFMELMLSVERVTGMKIADERLAHISTVRDIVNEVRGVVC